MGFRFFTPNSCILAGASSCGKTTYLSKILKNYKTMFEEVPVKIIWFYKRWQPAYDEMQKTIPIIEFEDSLPAEDFSTLAPVKTGGEGYLIVHWLPGW